jgi:hypothetical protein
MSKDAQGRISSRQIRRLMLIAFIVAVFAFGATAEISLRTEAKKSASQPNSTHSTQTQSTHANLSFRAGAQVPLDPQTGQVRPLTQDEAQQLAAGIKQLVNQSTDGLQSVRHPDGSVSMDLQGRFQNIAVAKLDEDGKLTQSCIDNPESAAAFFGIDPEVVGVKKGVSAPTINNAAQKGRDR